LTTTIAAQAQNPATPQIVHQKLFNAGDGLKHPFVKSKFGGYWTVQVRQLALNAMGLPLPIGTYGTACDSAFKFRCTIMKIDDNFNIVKSRCIISNSGYQVMNEFTILELNDGSIAVTGGINSVGNQPLDIVSPNTSYHAMTDIFMYKMDSNLNFCWRRFIGGSTDDIILSPGMQLPNGNLFYACYAMSADGDFTGRVIYNNPSNLPFSTLTLDTAGNLLNVGFIYTGAWGGYPKITNVARTNQGDYWYTGYTEQGDSGIIVKSDANQQLLFLKKVYKGIGVGGILPTHDGGAIMATLNRIFRLDASGNQLYDVALNAGVPTRYINSIAYAPDSTIIVMGTGIGETGSPDALLYKINKDNGSIIWYRSYGGTNEEVLHGGVLLPTGEIMILGRTESTDGDLAPVASMIGTFFTPPSGIWLARFSSILSASEASQQYFTLQKTSETTYQITTTKPTTLTLTDALGRQLRTIKMDANTTTIDLSMCAQGVYFVAATGYKSVKLVR
jgi:hypothetical protein